MALVMICAMVGLAVYAAAKTGMLAGLASVSLFVCAVLTAFLAIGV